MASIFCAMTVGIAATRKGEEMVKRNVQTVQIDPDALREELAKRNLTLSRVSIEMGHCDSYMNVKFSTKKMHENDVKMLELLYHIPRESYEMKETVEEVVDDTTLTEEPKFDYEELYRTIYSAVYAAVKESFS